MRAARRRDALLDGVYAAQDAAPAAELGVDEPAVADGELNFAALFGGGYTISDELEVPCPPSAAAA